MVASRTIPATIDLSTFDGPLANALRNALDTDQHMQLMDGGRLIANITSIRPVTESSTLVDNPTATERTIAERHRLVEELRGAFPDGVDAVELIREQRRHSWEE